MKQLSAPAFLVRCALVASVPAAASASAPPTPIPALGEARMVTYEFDDDRIYTVLVRPRNTTQIKLAAQERVTYVSAGDASNFSINVPSSKAFVEVKPKWENISTNLLIVTTRRSYHIELQSTAEGKKWYTRVGWAYREPAVLDQLPADAPGPAAAGASAAAASAPTDVLGTGVVLDKLFFKYRVEGEAAFRPAQVFDDGTHTYIRLPDNLQELPALFMVTPEDDDAALVNYSVVAPYLVVQRTMDKFLLKLGKAKVTVVRERPPRGFLSRFGLGASEAP